MKRRLLLGMTALTLTALVGFAGFTSHRANAHELNSYSGEDVAVDLTNDQFAKIENGEEVTVDGVVISGSSDEDVAVDLTNDQFAKIENGEEVTVDGIVISGLSEEYKEVALTDEQFAKIENGEEITTDGIVIKGEK